MLVLEDCGDFVGADRVYALASPGLDITCAGSFRERIDRRAGARTSHVPGRSP